MKTLHITHPDEQRKAAEFFIENGGRFNRTFAKAIEVTGKRSRKLLNRARRKLKDLPNDHARS